MDSKAGQCLEVSCFKSQKDKCILIKYIYILDQNIFSPFCICILATAKIYIQKRSKNNQHSCFFANSKLQHHKNTKCKEQKCKEQNAKYKNAEKKMQRTKIQKKKIHNEGNINRASAKEQGLLLAGTAGCFSGGDLDQDQVTPLGFFCRQQNISMSLKRLCFFLDGRSCTVSSKKSS